MAKPELGTKRVDPETGRKFYDLNKDPIVSPFTGVAYARSVFEAKPERVKPELVRAREPEVEEEISDEAVVEGDVEVIALEEVEDDAPADIGPEADEEDAVIPETDPLEIEAEIEPEDDATFLDEEEEEGDPVTDLLDVEGEDEDEV